MCDVWFIYDGFGGVCVRGACTCLVLFYVLLVLSSGLKMYYLICQ